MLEPASLPRVGCSVFVPDLGWKRFWGAADTENTHTEHEPTKIYVGTRHGIHNKYLLGFCDRRGRNHNTFSRSPGFDFLQLKHRENNKKTTINHFFHTVVVVRAVEPHENCTLFLLLLFLSLGNPRNNGTSSSATHGHRHTSGHTAHGIIWRKISI